MDLDLAEYAVEFARSLGAEYVEARLHSVEERGVILKDGEPQPLEALNAYGLAMRVIYGRALAFGSTNRVDREAARSLAERLLKSAKGSVGMFKNPIAFSDEKPEVAKWSAEEKEDIEGATPEWLIQKLKELDSIALESNSTLKNRYLSMHASIEEKYIVTSEGTRVQGRVPRLEFYGVLTSYSEGNIAQRSIQYGEAGGMEVFERLDIASKIAYESGILDRILKEARSSKIEFGDLIVGPEVAGIMAHESVGHPQEADRVLGREAAQAGESYLKPGDLGRKVGSEAAFVSDDPTLPHSFGFYLYDDEGVRARKRKLMVEGRINEFLHNRQTAKYFNLRSNGAARASLFDREPIVRMANTYVEPGDYSREELFEGVKQGIYIRSFMEWNIDDRRLNQRYVGHEAYLVENGEIKGMVRNPVIEITTLKLWSSLDARANDLEFVAATCGKGDPMQGVPVWTGGPHLRFRNIKIGRR